MSPDFDRAEVERPTGLVLLRVWVVSEARESVEYHKRLVEHARGGEGLPEGHVHEEIVWKASPINPDVGCESRFKVIAVVRRLSCARRLIGVKLSRVEVAYRMPATCSCFQNDSRLHKKHVQVG